MKTITTALTCISGTFAQNLITYPGKCPDIPNQPDFDVTRYIGVWYDYTSNDERNVPENANCVAAKYEILTENSISGKDSSRIHAVETSAGFSRTV